jgi:hypothetical protein
VLKDCAFITLVAMQAPRPGSYIRFAPYRYILFAMAAWLA